MALRIIRRPEDGLFAVWSTVADDFVTDWLSAEDVIRARAEYDRRAALAEARREVERLAAGEAHPFRGAPDEEYASCLAARKRLHGGAD